MLTPDELAILRKPEVQEYIREKMGGVEEGDAYLAEPEDPKSICVACKMCDTDEHGDWFKYFDTACFIPDCISRDSNRPERGLAGMLKGEWVLQYWGENDYEVTIRTGYELEYFIGQTPRLALLKALEWQIGRRKG